MSMRPTSLEPIPEQTARIAQAAFRIPTVAMMMRDELGKLFADEKFSDLFPTRGRGAESPQMLALSSVLQFVEGLTDRQTALAVRGRIDWKYALGLELEDSGFDPTILSDFRARLLEGRAERRLFELLLERCRERGWLKAGGTQRTDSTQVLGAIRSLNRLETGVETFRCALNALAVAFPEWLRPRLDQDWVERYGKRVEESRLPQKKTARQEYAETLGRDGMRLLEAIDSPSTPGLLRELPAVQTLRRVWLEQYHFKKGRLLWRPASEQPPATLRIVSPYDVEVRAGCHGDKSWEGYKAHLTEALDPKGPQLVVDVHSSAAPRGDSEDLPAIHQRLAQNQLLPQKHIVDGGYISAETLLQSQQRYGIDLIGPARPDSSAQARAKEGFGAEAFDIDFENRSAQCPGGKLSQSWSERHDSRYAKDVVYISFAKADCQACPLREACTRSKRGARTLQIQAQAQYEALAEARDRQKSPEFKLIYDQRAGIEGTLSQATRVFGLRRTRYRGQAKTELQNILSATALNLVRLFDWIHVIPRAHTRQAHFVTLARTG